MPEESVQKRGAGRKHGCWRLIAIAIFILLASAFCCGFVMGLAPYEEPAYIIVVPLPCPPPEQDQIS